MKPCYGAIIFIAILVIGVGLFLNECIQPTLTLPPIPNHHWHRSFLSATLYDNEGNESATIIYSILDDAAQVCAFEQHNNCKFFENNEMAIAWLKSVYNLPNIEIQ